jgi:hypothetical protein
MGVIISSHRDEIITPRDLLFWFCLLTKLAARRIILTNIPMASLYSLSLVIVIILALVLESQIWVGKLREAENFR